jgi:hypothetical protein
MKYMNSVIMAACALALGLPAGTAGAAMTAAAPAVGVAGAEWLQQKPKPERGQPQQAQRQAGQNRPAQAQGQGSQNRPTQAQGQNNRPEQAQRQGNQNRPAQAQGQGNQNRPAQAQGQGNQNRPPQAQRQGNQNRPEQAQRQSQGQGNRPEQAQRQGQPGADRAVPPGRQRAAEAAGRGNPPRGWTGGRVQPNELNRRIASLPEQFRPLATSTRHSDRMLLGATARGAARGLDVSNVLFRTSGPLMLVTNRRGDLLFEMSEDRARNLGAWDMRRLGDRRPNGNAPAFCRSGEGHPVWGRDWCLDKGFGLGSRSGTIWSRSTTIGDIIFGRRDRDRTDRGGLLATLGDVVFNRLAVHALTLGYTEPLQGTWTAERNAPQILRVHAGGVPVAEFIDLDRDDRVDVLYVVQPF